MRDAIAAVLVLAGLLAGTTPAIAQTPAEEQAFETALAGRDMIAAASHLDRLITARLPQDGKPRPDTYLNHRAGRFLLVAGHPRVALPWLEAADDPAMTGAERGRVALDRARALLALGDADAALPLVDAALRDLTHSRDRSIAQRLRIDALLATDPLAAVAALAGAAGQRAGDSSAEWDWALLDARGALLTGAPSAPAKARHAWNSATAAPLHASAPARAAAMLAMVEEQAGNRSAALAMMAAATRAEPDVTEISKKLAAMLPLCGATVTRADHVTVALHRDGYGGGTRISAIAASRPTIVPHFLSGVSAGDIMDADMLSTAATIARLQCRTSPAADALSRTVDRDPASRFMARHGLFPRAGYKGTPEDQLNAASREVDELVARFGADSPLLFGPLIRLIALSPAQLTQSGNIAPTRLIELNDRLTRVLRRVGDTSAFLPPDNHFLAAFARAMNAPSREASAKVMMDSFRAFVGTVEFSIGYASVASNAEENDPGQLDAIRADLLARGVRTLPADDPRLMALRLERVRSARTAADGTLAARIRETGLPGDLCTVQTVLPQLTGVEISEDDYPADGLLAELTGRTTLEFDLDATGQVKARRTIVAMPPMLFDSILAQRLDTIRYSAAQGVRGPAACRGLIQAIRWKMPDPDEEGASPIIGQTWMPGS